MKLDKFTKLERIRCNGHLSAVMEISLPVLLFESDNTDESIFNSFYESLADEYIKAARSKFEKAEHLGASPTLVRISFSDETSVLSEREPELLKKHPTLIAVLRSISVRQGGEIKKHAEYDLFDPSFGVFIKYKGKKFGSAVKCKKDKLTSSVKSVPLA